MKKPLCVLLGLGLLLLYPLTSAWGQGAYGERQFNNQLNSLRTQLRPHFGNARRQLGQLRQQGVNTSGWERQLNWVESQLSNMRWKGSTGAIGGGMGPGLQTINPFGDYLFHGVSIRPKDGQLVTRHLDPDGLVARAEAWARELRDVGRDLSAREGAERQKYLSDINDKLAQLAAITNERLQVASLGGGVELKPETLGDDLAPVGLPGLQGETPMLLRDPFGRDDPTRAPGGPIFGDSRKSSPVDPSQLAANLGRDARLWEKISGSDKLIKTEVPPPAQETGRGWWSEMSDTALPKVGEAVRSAFREATREVAGTVSGQPLRSLHYAAVEHSEPASASIEGGIQAGAAHASAKLGGKWDPAAKEWKPDHSAGVKLGDKIRLGGGGNATQETLENVADFKLDIGVAKTKHTVRYREDGQTIIETEALIGRTGGPVQASAGPYGTYNVQTGAATYGVAGNLQAGADTQKMYLKVKMGARVVEQPWVKLPDQPMIPAAANNLANRWIGSSNRP